MARGGRAWRGWFPFEGELTSGRPDRKEGIYFGEELPADDPRVGAGTPLHGPNLFPVAGARAPRRGARLPRRHDRARATPCCGAWPSASASTPGWFHEHLTADPLILFRIFRYPPEAGLAEPNWGVAEHTDYGLLTMLRQDDQRRARRCTRRRAGSTRRRSPARSCATSATCSSA